MTADWNNSYAIPVVTRFVSDFLGFFDCIKTPAHTDRKYDENQIYQHIQSCQDYLAYDSDETTIWKRRMAFKNSVNFLKELSEYGATQTKGRLFGWFPRETQTGGDKGYVVAVRDFGVQVSKAMATRLENAEEVAAMMLVVALDVAHKSVMTVSAAAGSAFCFHYLPCLLVHGSSGPLYRSSSRRKAGRVQLGHNSGPRIRG